MAGHLKESDSLYWKHNFPSLWTLYRALPPSPTFKTKPFLHLQQCFIWSKAFQLRESAMEFGWPVLQRGRTVQTSFFNFDHSNGFACTKPAAGVVDVHSVDAWRSYFEANKQNNKLVKNLFLFCFFYFLWYLTLCMLIVNVNLSFPVF